MNEQEHIRRAWLILSVGGILLVVTMPSFYIETGISLLIADLAFALLSPAVSIFLLCKIATRNGLLKRNEPIRTWGYIWRSLVAYYVSFIPTALALALSVGVEQLQSLLGRITFNLTQFVMLAVTIWLFFSQDRRGQLRWTLSLLRGY